MIDESLLRYAARAIVEIDQLGQLPDLQDWIGSAKRERHQNDPSFVSDRRWRLNNPMSRSRHLGAKLASLTGAPQELCITAVIAEADPDGAEDMLREVLAFRDSLRQQPRLKGKLVSPSAERRKQSAMQKLYGGTRKKAGA